MKKQQIMQIIALFFIIITLSGMLIGTDVYAEVHDGIVTVLCLSCLKLDPKTSAEFTFNTATGESHPPFVLENLSEGIVFLHFSEDACPGCDIMYPVIKDLFSIDFEKDEMYSTILSYKNETIAYFYTNIDHASTQRSDALGIYDQRDLKGLPMFTIVSLGYDKGIIRPYYTSLYGTLGFDTNPDRLQFLQTTLQESIELYEENRPGYQP
jgi:hypothetical protein